MFIGLAVLVISFLLGYYFGMREAKVAFPAPLEVWVKEEGDRIDTGVGPDVIKFRDGTWRMYYSVEEGIVSAVSENGLDWTREEEICLGPDSSSKYQVNVTSPEVFAIKDGRYRMLFSGSDEKKKTWRLFSAVSEDGITWKRESGTRLEEKNSFGQYMATVPDVVELSDGKIRLYYSDGNSIKSAISEDGGLKWKKEKVFGLQEPSMDPSVIIMPNGVHKIYYTISDSDSEPKNLRIVSAHSEDGIHWERDRGIRVKADEGAEMVMDPDVVKVSMTKLRMYYSQLNEGSLTDSRKPPVLSIRSAIIDLR